MNRLAWVDYAKGIGILLVVYGHVLRGLESSNLALSATFYSISDQLVYGFHMPLFFFLSGLFVEKWITKDLSTGISQKVKTIVYPYLIWSVLQGSVNVILSSYTNAKMSWGDLLKMFYDPFGQFWFLYVLFLIFIFYYFGRKIMSLQVMFLVSIVLFLLSPYLNFWVLDRFSYQLVFFVGGAMLMTLNFDQLVANMTNKHLLITFAAFALVNLLYLSTNTPHAYGFVVAVTGMALTIAVSVSLAKENLGRILSYLGGLSMVIYLAHILATSGFRILLSKGAGVSDVTTHIILGTIAGVVLPLVGYWVTSYLKLNGPLFGYYSNKK